MKLTKKSKEAFEKWYIDNKLHYDKLTVIYEVRINQFYKLHLSMQFGIYVDFFESVGIYVSVMPNCFHLDNDVPKFTMFGYNYWVEGDGFFYESDDSHDRTREEARKKAIEKANEIYNEL
jgi:hypothetical protein